MNPRDTRPLLKNTLLTFATALLLNACGGEESAPAPQAQQQQASQAAAQDSPAGATVQDVAAQARPIHERVMALDTHVDIPFDFASDSHDPLAADAQVNLEKMMEGGLDAAFFVVYVGQQERNADSYAQAARDAITKFEAIHRMAEDMYPDRIGLATTAQAARRIVREGKLAALIGIENGFVIGEDLSLLRDFRDRGARYMTLVHNGHNAIGDSAQPQERLGDVPQEHNGLSDFGNEVVDEMNRLGILVDVSHVSRQTMLDATARSGAPVIASHSSVKGVTDHPRNMDDEQLQALADNGGVIQIVAFDSYVKEVPEARTQALEQLRGGLGIESQADLENLGEDDRLRYESELASIDEEYPPADVEDFVDHIDYAVQLIGVDHVGISSDFGGGGGISGWDGAEDTFNITLELVSRGYTEEEIAKIWSGNVLRIMEEAEQVASYSPSSSD